MTRTVRSDVLGVPMDFTITDQVVGDNIKITVLCQMPEMKWDTERQLLRMFPPQNDKDMHKIRN